MNRKELQDRVDTLGHENLHLKLELKEARDEAATVRRAYLHEKGRAEAAIRVLKQNGYGGVALTLEKGAYRGPAERIAARVVDPS